jgi:COMPASS component SWD3
MSTMEEEKGGEFKGGESKGEEEVSHFMLVPRVTIKDNSSEIFSVRFSPDSMHLAAGGGDGSIRIFNADDGKRSHIVEGGSSTSEPTTCIRFRPNTSVHRTKNVFLTANACGIVQHWHMSSNKCLHTFSDHAEQVFALDYNDMGSQFVTAGKDGKVRVYDEATKTKIITLEGGLLGDYSREASGHSNRVFSVKFTHDENILLSAGWDNTVQMWDVRQQCSVRSLQGPHICGDALDLKNGQILTGSWRPKEQLELWDFGTGERITEIPWQSDEGDKSCMLYAAQFSKDSMGRFIVAGGSGANEAKVFDHMAGNAVVGSVTGMTHGVFSVDFSPDGEKVAIAGADACIRILDVVKKRDYYY